MKQRQFFTNLIILLVTGLFSCTNPNAPETSYTVTVNGTVVRKSSFPLDSVQIVVDKPFQRDSVAANGKFQISFTTPDNNAGSSKLTFSRSRFSDTTVTVSYSSSAKSIDLGAVVMVSQDSSENTATPGKASSRADKVIFVSTTFNSLSINGAGGQDFSSLTFEVRDSAGNPVDINNRAKVHFTFVARPDSFVTFNLDSASTDASGRVSVLLTAGKKAGIAQIQAYTRIDSLKLTIRSQIVSIPIFGGQADSTHFSLTSATKNIPGGVVLGLRDQITALLGDSAGNPAHPGTVVYFSSNGGIIQPYGTSSNDGSVAVDLISGNPFPPGGIATVTAVVGSGGGTSSVAPGSGPKTPKHIGVSNVGPRRTAKEKKLAQFFGDEDSPNSGVTNAVQSSGAGTSVHLSAIFSQSLRIMFSGKTTISLKTASDTSFVIPSTNSKLLEYTVADPLGNPLSGGTTITVTTDASSNSDVDITGDVNTTLPDTQDKTYTKFKAYIQDKRLVKNVSKPVNIIITVTSQNGNSSMTLQGHLLGVNVADSGNVAQINSFNTISPDTIGVSGTALRNFKNLKFQVLNALGQPSKNIAVQFTLTQSTGGGEYLETRSAVSDSNGVVSTKLVSGIRSGTVQVVAQVSSDSITVSSLPVTVYIRTGPIAYVVLVNNPQLNLSVRGVGGTESATLVFEARDSLGNPIDASYADSIHFAISGDSSAMATASLYPLVVLTDPATGRAVTHFTSGYGSGIVQVTALARLRAIKSAPVSFTVAGGLVPPYHLSFISPPQNVSYIKGGSVTLRVVASDKYSNPIPVSTPIYFTTNNAGSITTPGYTDALGQATATLQVVPPIPANGKASVTAWAYGEGGAKVSDSVVIIFSGAPAITVNNVPTDTIKLSDGGVFDVNYEVSDLLGNPLSKSNSISVSVSGPASSDIALTGDVNVTMPETQDTIQGTTKFTFRAADKFAGSGTSGSFLITITVTGESGTVVKVLQGELFAPGDLIVVPPSARQPAQIAFLSNTASDIFVSGVGGLENSVISYEVRDSLGQPIDKSRRAYATFTPQFFANSTIGGGTAPTLIPTADSTDDQGRLRVSVVSGTEAGVLKVLVTIQLPGKTVTSQPVKITVHAGFADQHHFSILPSRFVFPGIDGYNEIPFTVVIGDTFSNPVTTGTAVYFHSQAGIIQTGSSDFNAYTDISGKATVRLLTVNPTPTSLPFFDSTIVNPNTGLPVGRVGYEWVYAQTQGSNSQNVIDSVFVLWTRLPITVQGIPRVDSVVTIDSSTRTSAPISITVKDGNGNPLPDGTTISVSVVPPDNPPTGFKVSASGDISSTLPVTIPNAGYARFPGRGITDFSFVVVDQSAGTFAGTTVTVVLTVNSPGLGTWSQSFTARIQ